MKDTADIATLFFDEKLYFDAVNSLAELHEKIALAIAANGQQT